TLLLLPLAILTPSPDRPGAASHGLSLNQSAIARRIRLREEPASAAIRLLRHPDLLERRPVVGSALAEQESAAVRPLQGEVHLRPAVVRGAAVVPRAFVVVDAEEGRLVRRMSREAMDMVGAAPPQVPDPALVC